MEASVVDMCLTMSVSIMSAVGNIIVEAGGVIRYSPPYPVDEYILLSVPRADAYQPAVKLVCHTLNVETVN